MKSGILSLLAFAATVVLAADVAAQDDPAGIFFSAYQEYQRAERLERDGQQSEAAAKFRFVASQLGQLKSQNPDWQPLVVDFRLKKTQEALVRLEGSLDSPTLGPPPDLPDLSGEEDTLPPVAPPRKSAGAAPPSISISADSTEDPASPDTPVAAAPAGGEDAGQLLGQLEAEKSRGAELEEKLRRAEAEFTGASMELEKTKVLVTDLQFRLQQAEQGGGAASSGGKALEEKLAAAMADKEEAAARMAESAKQIEALTGDLQTAQAAAESLKAEAEQAKSRVAELEKEKESLVSARDEAVAQADTAKQEAQQLTARVAELEAERTQLIAARDEAEKQVAEAKTALEKNAELIEANRQLESKLTEAAAKITGMESDASAKEQVIAGLQGDLDKVRSELADAQTKLKDDRHRFDELQAMNDQLLAQYDEVTGALAAVKLGDVTAAEAKLIQEENEILRGIIMRQIKEQARREQAYRLAQEEMERLEIRSDTLNDKINELAKPTLKLTDAEQEMLKSPVVTLLDADAAKMSARVEVLKPEVDGVAPADKSTDEQKQDGELQTADSSAAVDGQSPDATAPAQPDESSAQSPAPGSEAAAAAQSLDAAADQSPETIALVNEARDEFVRGNFARAEQLYQKLADLQPNNVVALANLGVAQFRQGKLTAAQLALEKAIKVDPNDAFSLTTLGAVMIEQNRSEDAVALLEKANTVVADDPITLNYLGVASSQLGQFGKAEGSLRRAITVKPDYAEAHFNLAVIYATAKPPSIALAKRHYEKALELGAGPDKRLASMLQKTPGS
ncbi:MAG: tetratricopeptide repeat protein [Chthoniobacterales bacterium]|nr:tetratricopeptide repeat protein [Chthoniobacterales bacterium]